MTTTTVTALANQLTTTYLHNSTYWSAADTKVFVRDGIQSLYPTWFIRKTEETTAAAGSIQTMPMGCRNVHEVMVHSPTDRPRFLRMWSEGDGNAYIPVTQLGPGSVAGKKLVWAWTDGVTLPADDVTNFTLNQEMVVPVLLKAKIAALESLLTTRVQSDAFLAQQVRRDINENEIVEAINSADATLRELAQAAVKLPEVRR